MLQYITIKEYRHIKHLINAMRKRAAEKETQAVQNAAPAAKTPDKSAQAGQ